MKLPESGARVVSCSGFNQGVARQERPPRRPGNKRLPRKPGASRFHGDLSSLSPAVSPVCQPVTPPPPVPEASSGRRLFAFLIYKVPFVMWSMEALTYAFQFQLLRFYAEKEAVDFIAGLYRETKLLLQPMESYFLHTLVRMQAPLPGDMAEVGTYRGASAKLICAGKGDRHFFGFDTFEGLPDVTDADRHWGVSYFRKQQFAAGLEGVKRYLAPFGRCELVPGLFPATGGVVADRKFSLVHVDTDLYMSTIDSLRFFWERMVAGGMIVIHDSHSEGVRRAIAEFMNETGAAGFRGALSQYVLIRR
jgi:O-methyltransferase